LGQALACSTLSVVRGFRQFLALVFAGLGAFTVWSLVRLIAVLRNPANMVVVEPGGPRVAIVSLSLIALAFFSAAFVVLPRRGKTRNSD
jgi:hypothetical protein